MKIVHFLFYNSIYTLLLDCFYYTALSLEKLWGLGIFVTGAVLPPSVMLFQLFLKSDLDFILKINITTMQALEHIPVLFILE